MIRLYSKGARLPGPEIRELVLIEVNPTRVVLNKNSTDTFELGPVEGGGEVELSIVLPALNEELNIGECVDWCFEGLRKAGAIGEVIIIDSSTDRTPEIAMAHGARVIRTPKRGLGRAYIEAMPFIRGKFVLMGDCDCTYDFRELAGFLEKMREGREFVMGSRFKGSIEAGAMPVHHQYFGTPLTTWILNRIFSSRFSDIHCGMRGISTGALKRMNIVSDSWEYASEMVVKSVHMRLPFAEVPVRFYKDRNGRQSHHLRAGWWSPWAAGWINLKIMFIYGSNFFLMKPGILFLSLGLLLTVPLAFGPITIGPVTLSIFWMLLGLLLSVFGLQCLFIGLLSRAFFDYGGELVKRYSQRFPYTRTTILAALIFFTGLVLDVAFFSAYVRNRFALSLTSNREALHSAVFGMFLMLIGFMTFVFMLIFNGYLLSQRSKVHDTEVSR